MNSLVDTPIGPIASDWSPQPISELCEPPQYGYTATARENGNAQFLRITDISDGSVDWSSVPYCNCPGEDLKRYRLQTGDIVFARIGATTGKSHLIVDPPISIFASYLIRVRPTHEVDSFFLSHYFKSIPYWRQVNSQKNANLKKGVSGSLLKALLVPKPPIAEQRKIAAVLSLVQRAIERQDRLLALTAELKKALLHKLFTEGLYGEPQKETEIGPVPQNWQVGRLDSFCLLQRGFDVTKKEQQSGTVPVVSSGGISSYHNVARVKGPGVVIGRKGSLGTVHYVEVDYWPHDTTLWVKDFKGNDPRFAAYLLERMQLGRFDSGASNPTLNRNTIHPEKVAYPRPDEQREIGRIIQLTEQKYALHTRKRTALQDLFRTLLHQLMTAQIRVNHLDLSEEDFS